MKQFNFGENWLDFSNQFVDEGKIIEAEKSLQNLVGEEKIKDKSLIDIGCGSGIFAIAAKRLGSKEVIGIDISAESIEAAKLNKSKFLPCEKVMFYQKSILDKDYLDIGSFDIVYSWGVLHHTGRMYEAISNSLQLVKKDGLFVIAIYNKHWSSWGWKIVKYIYNIVPVFLKKIMVYFLSFPILAAKFLVTGKNPLKMRRGMSFYYNIIDWLGGYPYEYASPKEIVDFVEKRGFKIQKITKPKVPTACSEFVFAKI